MFKESRNTEGMDGDNDVSHPNIEGGFDDRLQEFERREKTVVFSKAEMLQKLSICRDLRQSSHQLLDEMGKLESEIGDLKKKKL